MAIQPQPYQMPIMPLAAPRAPRTPAQQMAAQGTGIINGGGAVAPPPDVQPGTAPVAPVPVPETAVASAPQSYVLGQRPAEMLAPGNINVTDRAPVWQRPSWPATAQHAVVAVDPTTGHHVVVPSFGANGPITPAQAMQQFRAGGQHYGYFNNPTAAQAYAQMIQQWRQQLYRPVVPQRAPVAPAVQATPAAVVATQEVTGQ